MPLPHHHVPYGTLFAASLSLSLSRDRDREAGWSGIGVSGSSVRHSQFQHISFARSRFSLRIAFIVLMQSCYVAAKKREIKSLIYDVPNSDCLDGRRTCRVGGEKHYLSTSFTIKIGSHNINTETTHSGRISLFGREEFVWQRKVWPNHI